MAEQPNLEDIKEALVSSGVLKSATITEEEREKIQKALAAKGWLPPPRIICHPLRFCIVMPE